MNTKILLVGIILLSTITPSRAQSWQCDWVVHYGYTAPAGNMKHYIRKGNGVMLDFGMITPSRRFSVGLEVNYTQYGFDKSKQTYEFSDGTTAKMDVTVTNSFVNFMAVSRYFLRTKGDFIPYFSFKAGYSYYSTDLNIYDPDEWDHCEPVETDLLQHDGIMIASAGAGVRWDLSKIFKKLEDGRLFMDLNANFTQGGYVDYMNTDAPNSMHQHTNDDATEVEADFLNTQTQIVHKHHVGYLYTSPVQMMDYRIGFVFRFN